MKAAEKQLIYDLLKKASGAVMGYTYGEFSKDVSFQDDAPPSCEAGGEAANRAAVQYGSASKRGVQPERDEGKGAATIESIAKKIAACRNCGLARTRRNVVPGEGVPNPAVLVVGEGPGADEDEQGRPFVGKAGQLLDRMLAAINLYRSKNCFIANIVKCRPPMNRDPSPEECAACSAFLRAQIHVLKPKMILAFGRIALQKMQDTSIGITRMHGKILDYEGVPFMATFHPSALLRDETYKRLAWEDLKTFRAKLLEICPDYESAVR